METATFNTQLYTFKDCLKGFAMTFTKDDDDANDLVQDTLLKAIRYSNSYHEGTNLKGWLYTILRNTFINDYRRKKHGKTMITVTEDISSQQLVISAAHNKCENKFMMEDIQVALKNLEPNYRIPFIKYFEGYKYHEIAEELHIPIGTVKTRIHVARVILKKNLKMYSDEFRRVG